MSGASFPTARTPTRNQRRSAIPAWWRVPHDIVPLSVVGARARFHDSTAAWCRRAMSGMSHSGIRVRDPRSDNDLTGAA